MVRYNLRTFAMELILILVALLFIVPFYFLLANSLKTFGELLSNSASWPTTFHWLNYSKAWKITKFPHAFWNSLQITVISNLLIALVSSMAAYRLVRRKSRTNAVIFTMLVAALIIPFQSIMIPLLRVTKFLDLSNSMIGLVICYLGFGVPLTVFLFHGFIKSIPIEIEESATVDGCSPYAVFWQIVFPLLKPMLITVILLNSLWIWNDYLLPSLILQDQTLRTIPIAIYAFFGQYTKQWDLALPALVLGILPIIVFFLAMQRYIIEGITIGSVKG